MPSSLKWALIFFLAFAIFSIPVALGTFNSLDQNTTVSLQNWFTVSFDTPLSFFSLLGSFEITTLILVIVLAKLGLKKSLIVLTVFFSGVGLELLGKIFLYHPGPPSLFLRYNLGFYFMSGIVQTGHSYPSGHSYRTAFIAFLLIYLIQTAKKLQPNAKKWLTASLLLILLTMLISRISLGEHWTTDVIGGLLLGTSFASFSIYLIRTGFLPSNRVK
ncbi:MAG: phosphatase PAP2 family protein [Microgenomates group bacterium]